MHLAMIIDGPRREDDAPTLTAVMSTMQEAGIEQTHILNTTTHGIAAEPLIEGADIRTTPMPGRWWSRHHAANTLADTFMKKRVDALFWSGDDAAQMAYRLAMRLEVPLMADVWTRDQAMAASSSPHVETWIARSQAVADIIRDHQPNGTIIVARPPLSTWPPPRLPGQRPSIVCLDPGSHAGGTTRTADILRRIAESRTDAELFVELKGGRSHQLWRQLHQQDLLDRVTVLDQVGVLGQLVAAATIVLAPDPSGPARSLLPLALAGDAAVITASVDCEDLLVPDETTILSDPQHPTHMADACLDLLESPSKRSTMADAGRRLARAACHPDECHAAWITACRSTMEPATYPIGMA